MQFRRLFTVTSLFALAVGAYTDLCAAGAPPANQYDPKMLAQVEALYGLSPDAAVTRLAKEYDAAEQARRIEDLRLPSYAGSWFDSITQRLQVAISSQSDAAAVQNVGAVPVLAGHSLAELEAARNSIASDLVAELGEGVVRDSHVDVQANTVVFGISKGKLEQASATRAAHVGVPVRFEVGGDNIKFSSNLFGADGTKNATWVAENGQAHPCSVGANAETVSGSSYVAGFATAGHCGETNNTFETSGGASLGTVITSEMKRQLNGPGYPTTPHVDAAWVQVDTGWVTVPQVNGYSDGTINVSGTWAGALISPVGTTVCRYGSASGGPHCASVTALNYTVSIGILSFPGMIQVCGISTSDGDSGGPLLAPSGQIQGTDTGGEISSSTCTGNADVVFFEPIATSLARVGTKLSKSVAMLTSHGRSAPTVSLFACPDMANSGGHAYTCDYSSYDSQGPTSNSWTSNTGNSSTTTELSGTCSTGQVVNVTLAISNPYGTTYKYGSFNCPTNPPP